MGYETICIQKKVGNVFPKFIIENLLLSLKMSKDSMAFIITQPTEENPKNYVKVFLECKDCVSFLYALRRNYPSGSSGEVLKTVAGGMMAKYNNVVARIFKLEQNNGSFKITIEEVEGDQKTVVNGAGERVNGIVSPKRGGKVLQKLSFILNREEAIYVSFMIEQDLQSWRNVLAKEERLKEMQLQKEEERRKNQSVDYNKTSVNTY